MRLGVLRSLVSTLAAVVGLFLAVLGGQVVEPTLLLAVVRTDGLLVPFAVHHKGEWWNAWPFGPHGQLATTSLPDSVAEMPKDWLPPGLVLPQEWKMWPVESGATRTVTVQGFARPESSSMAMIGLTTDFSKDRSEIERITVRDGDAGIALVGDATVGRVTSIVANSAEWQAVLSTVVERVRNAERIATINHINEVERSGNASTRVLPSTAETSASQFVFTLQQTSDSGRLWYRLSGIREYFGDRSGPCSPRTEVTGILHQKVGEAPTVTSLSAFTSDGCRDPEGVELLGSLHWSDGVLWIARVDGDGGFGYGLIDPSAADPHLLTMKGLWSLRR